MLFLVLHSPKNERPFRTSGNSGAGAWAATVTAAVSTAVTATARAGRKDVLKMVHFDTTAKWMIKSGQCNSEA
jgi:hypothetical protein